MGDDAGRRFAAAWCSIELAPGWHAQAGPDSIALSNADPAILLRVNTFDSAVGRVTARQWAEMAARVHPPKGRPLESVRCGDFTGYRTEMAVDPAVAGWLPKDARETYRLSLWLLACDGIPIDASYACPLSLAGRYDGAVTAMLETLRSASPSNAR